MSTKKPLIAIRHPDYDEHYSEWEKWRLAFEGGRNFIDRYMVKLCSRESDSDFATRKTIAYCPAFAKAAIIEIKNAIYQRMTDVTRVGGPSSFTKACLGQIGGVDLLGATMNKFIGADVLQSLLPMKRVGVLVDNYRDLGTTFADKQERHPYLGLYKTENILSWSWARYNNTKRLQSILLQECIEDLDDSTGLPCGIVDRWRLMQRVEGEGVKVTFYDSDSYIQEEYMLENENIPFVLFEIPESLMKDVADYQIALMNMESADVSYALKMNYPIYYEFFNPKTEPIHQKPLAAPGDTGTAASQHKSKDVEVAVGSTHGRRFPQGLEAPGFINPSAETLTVSMEKEQQIKEDIRRLVNLNLSEVGRQRQSAESKQEDQRGLDSALSFIGFILAQGENEIAEHWAFFEGSREKTEIKYPENYSLKSNKDRREEAKELKDGMHDLPSDSYKRHVAKKIARITIGHEVTYSDLEKIYVEIDGAITLTSDPDQIIADHEAGLVSDETASLARGYKKGEVEQAKKDRAEHIALTLEAQGGIDNANAARGAPEFGGKDGAEEKDGKEQRGEGKKVNKDE